MRRCGPRSGRPPRQPRTIAVFSPRSDAEVEGERERAHLQTRGQEDLASSIQEPVPRLRRDHLDLDPHGKYLLMLLLCLRHYYCITLTFIARTYVNRKRFLVGNMYAISCISNFISSLFIMFLSRPSHLPCVYHTKIIPSAVVQCNDSTACKSLGD